MCFTPPLLLAATPICTFLWRRICPLGWYFTPLGLQPAYLPQYILAYFTGIFLSSNPHLVFPPPDAPPQSSRTKWWTSPLPALGAYAAYTSVLLASPVMRGVVRDPSPLYGSNKVAFLFCIWNELGFAALTHTILRLAHL